MLTLEDTQRILEDHEVFDRDPDAADQHLDWVLLTVGETRAEIHQRAPRIDDGIFAAWGICLPMFPQPRSYSELMRQRRREWFQGVPQEEATYRARNFFTVDFLRLDLGELASLVTREDAVNVIAPYLGESPGSTPTASA